MPIRFTDRSSLAFSSFEVKRSNAEGSMLFGGRVIIGYTKFRLVKAEYLILRLNPSGGVNW